MQVVQTSKKPIVEELTNIYDELHFALNICEHSESPHFSTPYCFKLHNIREDARRFFGSDDFRSTSMADDYEFYFFEPLKEAKRIVGKSRDVSIYYVRIAMSYVRNLIKLLS